MYEHTGFLLTTVFFPKNFLLFLYSASFAAALVFYLPGVCTHTDTKGKQSPEYFKIFEKNTIFNEHLVVTRGMKTCTAALMIHLNLSTTLLLKNSNDKMQLFITLVQI